MPRYNGCMKLIIELEKGDKQRFVNYPYEAIVVDEWGNEWVGMNITTLDFEAMNFDELAERYKLVKVITEL